MGSPVSDDGRGLKRLVSGLPVADRAVRPSVMTGVDLRIPVNVTADSGNVTGIPANVTGGRCCAF